MKATLFISLLLFTTFTSFTSHATDSIPTVSFYPSLHIITATRTVDISTHIESVTVVMTVENRGQQSVNELIVAMPVEKMEHLSYLEGTTVKRKSGKPGRSLFAELVKLSNPPSTTVSNSTLPLSAVQFFKLELAKPLTPSQSTKLNIHYAYTHTLTPLPTHIKQDDQQLALYTDNLYILSMYPIETQTSVLQLYSSKTESYTKKGVPVVKSDNKLTYGEFTNMTPLSYAPLQVHSQNNSPFITFTTMRKDIEVSHWGNIAIEEVYNMKHTGAQLIGSFSRVNYQRKGNTAPSAVNALKASLPLKASQIYYRDVIGNVSTSHVRVNSRGSETVLEIQPRFPLFGGWKNDFTIGYNVPSKFYLSRSLQQRNHYVLNISFGSMFSGAATDDAIIRVILPEGASNIEYSTPFHVDRVYTTTHKTHLDTSGRPVLVLEKQHVIKHHDQNFLVKYEFQAVSLMREPMLVVGAFMIMFAIAMVYYRVNLKFEPDTLQTKAKTA